MITDTPLSSGESVAIISLTYKDGSLYEARINDDSSLEYASREGKIVMKKDFQKHMAGKILTVLLGLSVVCLMTFSAGASWGQAKDNAGTRCYEEIAKTMVHGTAVGLGNLLKDVKGEKKRIALIKAFIAPVRFFPDQSGYFYAYDFKCVNIAHAIQKELPGKNLYNHQDTKGKYVIRELSAAAKNGGGFVEFYWLKPGTQGEQKKLGYVEAIPGTNYFIGTGVYIP